MAGSAGPAAHPYEPPLWWFCLLPFTSLDYSSCHRTDCWVGIASQRLEGFNRRKKSRDETPPACREPPASPLYRASPTHCFSWPGRAHETEGSVGSPCSGVLYLPQECSSAPAAGSALVARQHTQHTQHTQHCPHSPLQITFSFSLLWCPECCKASPRERAPIRPPVPNTLPGAQTPTLPAQLLPLPCHRQGRCPREDLSKALVGATGMGRVYLGAAGLRSVARAGPKEGPRGWAHQ